MPVEKKEILPDIAKRMSLNRFFAAQRDVINDELEALVPDLIEDALENPTGSYQRATRSQMYQLTKVNRTAKDIKKDTAEILRFLNKELSARLDNIEANSGGGSLIGNLLTGAGGGILAGLLAGGRNLVGKGMQGLGGLFGGKNPPTTSPTPTISPTSKPSLLSRIGSTFEDISGKIKNIGKSGMQALTSKSNIAVASALAAYNIWTAWQEISNLPTPPEISLDDYETKIGDIIAACVAEVGLTITITGFATLVGAAAGAGIGAVPGFLLGAISAAVAEYSIGEDVRDLGKNETFRALVKKVVGFFLSDETKSKDKEKKLKDQDLKNKQMVRELKVPNAEDPNRGLSESQLAAKGLRFKGTENRGRAGGTVNVYEKIDFSSVAGPIAAGGAAAATAAVSDTTAPMMGAPVVIAGGGTAGPAPGSPEARLVQIGQEQGLAKKEGGVTLSLLSHLQGASGAAAFGGGGGSGGGGGGGGSGGGGGGGSGSATAEAPKALTAEQTGFFSDLSKGAIDAGSSRAAFLSGKSNEELAKMGVQKVTQRDGTVMYQQKAVTEQEAIESLKAKATMGKNVESGTFADTLMQGETLPSVRKAGKAFQSYNKGEAHGYKAGTMDFAKTPLEEVMRLQNLPKNHPDKLFATGAFQVIPETMKEAVNALGLDPKTTMYDEATQTKIMAYLTTKKAGRQGIGSFIKGESDDLQLAQEQMSQEWASMASVSKGGRSYYGGPNKAHVSLAQTQAALEDARKRYKENIAAGMNPDQAYEKALVGTMGGGMSSQEAANFKPTADQVSQEMATLTKAQEQARVQQVGVAGGVSATSTSTTSTNQAPGGSGLMAQGDLEEIKYTSAPQTGTAQTGYSGGKTTATKVSQDYVNNQFLGAADFMTGLGIWPGGENPYFSESTSGQYKFDPKGGLAIDPVHKGQGHYGFKGQLAYDISVARMVQQAKDAGINLSEKDAHNVVVSMKDFLREQTGGAAGGSQEQKGKLGELYGPQRGSMVSGTGEAGHYRHFHYAPGTNLQRNDYNQMLQTLLTNPGALNDPKTGKPSATAQKLLQDLEKANFVQKNADGTYVRNDAIIPKEMKTALGLDKVQPVVASAPTSTLPTTTPTLQADTAASGLESYDPSKVSAASLGAAKLGVTPEKKKKMIQKQKDAAYTQRMAEREGGVAQDRKVPAKVSEPSVADQINDLKSQMAENAKPPPALVKPTDSPAIKMPSQVKTDYTSAAGRQVAYAAGVPMPPVGSGNAPFNAASFTMPGEFGMIS